MTPQNRSSEKKQRFLPPRACSVNILSGDIISRPDFTRIPLIANIAIPPHIIARLPFSLTRGEMLGFKEMTKTVTGPGTLEDFSQEEGATLSLAKARQAEVCPWCGGNNIRIEMRLSKQALWGCLSCQRRWWALADDSAKVVRAKPKLPQTVFKGMVRQIPGRFGR